MYWNYAKGTTAIAVGAPCKNEPLPKLQLKNVVFNLHPTNMSAICILNFNFTNIRTIHLYTLGPCGATWSSKLFFMNYPKTTVSTWTALVGLTPKYTVCIKRNYLKVEVLRVIACIHCTCTFTYSTCWGGDELTSIMVCGEGQTTEQCIEKHRLLIRTDIQVHFLLWCWNSWWLKEHVALDRTS